MQKILRPNIPSIPEPILHQIPQNFHTQHTQDIKQSTSIASSQKVPFTPENHSTSSMASRHNDSQKSIGSVKSEKSSRSLRKNLTVQIDHDNEAANLIDPVASPSPQPLPSPHFDQNIPSPSPKSQRSFQDTTKNLRLSSPENSKKSPDSSPAQSLKSEEYIEPRIVAQSPFTQNLYALQRLSKCVETLASKKNPGDNPYRPSPMPQHQKDQTIK